MTPTGCLTTYLVSDTVGGAPYSKIQDAIDQAETDGKGPGDPAVVLVCPGTYVEDVTLNTPDIDVVALAQNSQQAPSLRTGEGATTLVGKLTIDLVSAGTRNATTVRVQGIDILPAVGPAIVFGGSNNEASYVYVTDARIITDGDYCIRVTNTGAEGNFASVLDGQRLTLQRVDGAAEACSITGGAFPAFPAILLSESSILALAGDAVVADAGLLGFDTCVISHGQRGIVCRTAFGRADNCVFSGDEAPTFDLDATSQFRVVQPSITHSPSFPFVVGAGTFQHDAISFLGQPVPQWDTSTGLKTRTDEALPHEAYVKVVTLDGGSYEITTECHVVVNSTAAGGTIVLPLTDDRPGPIRLKLGPTNVGVVLVSRKGVTDQIRLGGATPAVSVPLTASGFELVAEKASNLWEGWAGGAGAQIPSGAVQLSAPDTTTSAVLVDIAGLSTTVTLTTSARIVGYMSWDCETSTGGLSAIAAFAVSINAADGQEIHRYLLGTNDVGAGPAQYRSAVLTPGTYTIKGRWRRVSGTATLQVTRAQLSAIGLQT